MAYNDQHFQCALQLIMDWYTEQSLGNDCTAIREKLEQEMSHLTDSQRSRLHEFHADLYLHGHED